MFQTPTHKQVDPSKLPAQRVNPVEGNAPVARTYFDKTRGLVTVGPRFDVTAQIIAYESGELDQEAVVELFQALIDTGMAWSLQGSYGRMAQQLIRHGFCQA